ncbi:MAG: hypothetical protein P8Y13_15755 [Deinococcales bacterium]
MAETSANDDSARWPEELDALVAAPEHHTLLYETEDVRVLDTVIRAGERTPVHTHRWSSVMVLLSWSAFVRYDDRGAVMVDSRKVPALASPPQVLPSDPLPPHSLENVGTEDLRLISVELKR